MSKTSKLIGAGVGLAAIAAGTYFLYGKNGPENRKRVRGWALKAKGEMLERLETLGRINREIFHGVVDRVADRYKKFKNVDKGELDKLVKESKGYWGNIDKDVSGKLKGGSGKTASTRRHGKTKARV